LRKNSTNLEAKRICYSEEHLLNKMNQNSLPLFMQNKTQKTKHSPTPTSHLYQYPVTFNIKPDPVGPIMTNPPVLQTQVVADKAKEYGMNKPTPFTGNQMKIRQFLGYLDMNQNIYNTD
jgi:hypothetical protein